MKITTVLGARPQFVKAAALSRVLKYTPGVEEKIIHTGQHYDANMSDIFFEQMQIPRPNHFLAVASKTHGEMTGRMIEGIERVLLDDRPDLVLVYGDTNSTLAGAIAARKLNIRLAHVEAGLRSFNDQMPEETNRVLTDRISDLLFCPGQQAVRNLHREGFQNFSCEIFEVGDIMKDVAYFYEKFEKAPPIQCPERFVLATIHRAENTNDPERLKSIVGSLEEIATDLPVILPLHPRTRGLCASFGIKWPKAVVLSDPIGYLEMLYLVKRCTMVLTDSGGLQKEAYFFKKPCITIRDQTEWVELVSAGYNEVVGVSREKVALAKERFLKNPPHFDSNLYGNGDTAEKIVDIIKK